ncbi:DUF3618 domain-containing protein [Streptomyces chumphonensis]|uniref:DUF3618 domain-containing protein n=1 Tax=Streptomyces chumphonensis TaxID=1214925 RepID=UPI003D755B83
MSRDFEAETSRDPRVLREQVKDTRAELGDTVAALAAKADVKAQARRKAADAREQAHQAARTARAGGRRNRVPLVATGAVVTVLVATALVLRKRHGWG